METQGRKYALDAVKRSRGTQFLICSLRDDGTSQVSITSYANVLRHRVWVQVRHDKISHRPRIDIEQMPILQ